MKTAFVCAKLILETKGMNQDACKLKVYEISWKFRKNSRVDRMGGAFYDKTQDRFDGFYTGGSR